MSATKISIPKEVLSQLPQVECPTTIEVIETAAQARKALGRLMRCKEVGIDTETRPNFRKGDNHKVSLIQVSTMKESYLFRINKTGLMSELCALLESPDVMKVGLSLRDDFNGLRRIAELEPQNVLELQDYVGNSALSTPVCKRYTGCFSGAVFRKGSGCRTGRRSS